MDLQVSNTITYFDHVMMIMKYEGGGTGTAYIEVLNWYLSERTEENSEKTHSEYFVPKPSFNLDNSQIHVTQFH
jgi:hypothetical protein